MFTTEFYTLENGTKPAERFISDLEPKMRSKAIGSLKILRERGNTLREPFSKPIGNGIFELRIKFASDITRIFYFFYVGEKIIITNGFIKKTAKTPAVEIDLARKYKADFEGRYRNG